MRRLSLIRLLLAALLLGSINIARAQTFSISWYKIAGGGGTSSNGNFSVTGTIGQPDAGTMSGGNFSLTGGFWGIIAAVQTAGSPLLSVTVASGSHILISWPVASTGFGLQQNPNVANKNGWSAVNTNSFPIVVANGLNTVTLPVTGSEYFRLISPAP